MDLGAYVQIEDLRNLANENGIVVHRLRGYRLMENEKPITDEEMAKQIRDAELSAVEHAYAARPAGSVSPAWFQYDYEVSMKLNRAIENRSSAEPRILWNRIRGRVRKTAKYFTKKYKKAAEEQWALWNEFAGKPGVLYIHSRDAAHLSDYKAQPWCLGACLDWFDNTYCDIYAKIGGE